MHYFPGMSKKDILWKYSYANITMLMSSIPDSTNSKKNKNKDLEVNSVEELIGLL